MKPHSALASIQPASLEMKSTAAQMTRNKQIVLLLLLGFVAGICATAGVLVLLKLSL